MSRPAQKVAHFYARVCWKAVCRAGALIGPDDGELFGFSHGLVAAWHIEFLVNVLGVTFYGSRSDKKLGCNLLVAQLFCQQFQDFELSLG